MKTDVQIFDTPEELALAVSSELNLMVNSQSLIGGRLNIVLSGGSTPKVLLRMLAQPPHNDKIDWTKINFFWGDERCVAPNHPDSNYGVAKETFLNHVAVPDGHVFRIRGEENPQQESSRYAEIIRTVVKNKNHMFPQFDWIFLGIGDDGHTASLFPGADTLRERDGICTVAQHPVTQQKRITLTLPVLNNASRITFLVTGVSKCKVVKEILQKLNEYQAYPAAMVKPISGALEWFLDKTAASAL